MGQKVIKLDEERLRTIVAESVKKVLNESDSRDIYEELCQIVGVKEIDDIEAKPTFQYGKTYLIFNDKFHVGDVDLKSFAKYFIRENNLNGKFIFDIKGFSDDYTLWVEVFRKNF